MIGLHVLEGSFGWSALGPGGNGGMKGASQIVVRKNDDDEWVAEDRYSTDYSTPTLDESQDIKLLFAQQDDVNGETSWGVILPQNSCDERDYPLDEDHNVFMIYALGSTHDFNFHGGARGQFTANLMGLPPHEPNMDDYDHVDLVMPNVSVVRGEEDLDPTNPFICSYFDMEVLGDDMGFTADDKVHMVGYEPVITEGNEKYLHHFTMFSCEGYAEGTPLQQKLDDSHLYHQKVIPSCTTCFVTTIQEDIKNDNEESAHTKEKPRMTSLGTKDDIHALLELYKVDKTVNKFRHDLQMPQFFEEEAHESTFLPYLANLSILRYQNW